MQPLNNSWDSELLPARAALLNLPSAGRGKGVAQCSKQPQGPEVRENILAWIRTKHKWTCCVPQLSWMSSLYSLPVSPVSNSSFTDSLLSSSFMWFSPGISRGIKTPLFSRNSVRYLWLQGCKNGGNKARSVTCLGAHLLLPACHVLGAITSHLTAVGRGLNWVLSLQKSMDRPLTGRQRQHTRPNVRKTTNSRFLRDGLHGFPFSSIFR